MARGSGGMDTGSIVKYGAIAAGGYFLYNWWSKRTPAVVVAGTGGGAVAPSAIDAIAARIMAAAGTSALFTADQWNVYLAQQLPVGKTAPDPAGYLGTTPREQTLSFAQYWGAVAPKLRSDLGMTGLGMFYGLGRIR